MFYLPKGKRIVKAMSGRKGNKLWKVIILLCYPLRSPIVFTFKFYTLFSAALACFLAVSLDKLVETAILNPVWTTPIVVPAACNDKKTQNKDDKLIIPQKWRADTLATSSLTLPISFVSTFFRLFYSFSLNLTFFKYPTCSHFFSLSVVGIIHVSSVTELQSRCLYRKSFRSHPKSQSYCYTV